MCSYMVNDKQNPIVNYERQDVKHKLDMTQ